MEPMHIAQFIYREVHCKLQRIIHPEEVNCKSKERKMLFQRALKDANEWVKGFMNRQNSFRRNINMFETSHTNVPPQAAIHNSMHNH